jgi:hypothetical protein
LAIYNNWEFKPVGCFRILAIVLMLTIALALAIAPLKN